MFDGGQNFHTHPAWFAVIVGVFHPRDQLPVQPRADGAAAAVNYCAPMAIDQSFTAPGVVAVVRRAIPQCATPLRS
jgi:hypothetical protein